MNAAAGIVRSQAQTIRRATPPRTADSRRDWAGTAAALHRLGVRPPCLVTGFEAIPIGYYTGCSSGAIAGNNESTTAGEILRTADRVPVAALTGPDGTPARAGTYYLRLTGTRDGDRALPFVRKVVVKERACRGNPLERARCRVAKRR